MLNRLHAHSVNYNKRDGRPKGRLVNVGFWLNRVPRLVLRCALFGHTPVVDGTDSMPSTAAYIGRRSRWVVCDWCGDRPNPQGSLDPQRWNIGEKYTGGHTNPVGRHDLIRLKDREHYLPGPFDHGNDDGGRSGGELGGQLIIGRQEMGVGFGLKVGNGGSEHTLAASLYLGWAGALYLHTSDGIGQWVQRRFNPDREKTYRSKEIEVRLSRGLLRWRWWVPRDATRKEAGVSWWRDGELNLRILDKFLGRRLYESTPVPGGETSRLVRMPEGDYLVGLKLKQVTVGRKRGRRRRMPYRVDWAALGKGIPTEGPLRGRIFDHFVEVSDQAVAAGTWPAAAAAAIATDIAAWRTRHEWEPTGQVKVQTAVGAGGAG